MDTSIVDVEHLLYRWPGRTRFSMSIPNFSVGTGETVLLLGQSGSGKSTLLSLISGTVEPDEGRIHVAGQDLKLLPSRARDQFRAESIGIIFQQFNLLPYASVADNIMLPLHFAPQRKTRAGDVARATADLCADLGLPKSITKERASLLSVGQQQRVAVARALIGEPSLILADEPTSALDAKSQSAFLDVMFNQVATKGTSLLMVSHDPGLSALFDRVIQLEDISHTKSAEA